MAFYKKRWWVCHSKMMLEREQKKKVYYTLVCSIVGCNDRNCRMKIRFSYAKNGSQSHFLHFDKNDNEETIPLVLFIDNLKKEPIKGLKRYMRHTCAPYSKWSCYIWLSIFTLYWRRWKPYNISKFLIAPTLATAVAK